MKFKEILPLLPQHLLLDIDYNTGSYHTTVRFANNFTNLLDKEITYITPQVFLDTNTIKNDNVSIFGNVKLEIILE